jgi:Asp-tRNA(Asn)/Glu-tRNA(Gln) amidotransferase A subunit family amidase
MIPTIADAAAGLRQGSLSPVELVELCLARIRALDPALRAWVHVDE